MRTRRPADRAAAWIAERHGGSITVHGSPAGGARFAFSLPLDGGGTRMSIARSNAYTRPVSSRVSAGILLYRLRPGGLEVLLGHPGGPWAMAKDAGHWSIPKGEVDGAGEDLLAVARREFAEETGHPVPAGALLALGETRQKGGKLVHAWAAEGDLDPAAASSNTFEMEWPPGSGRFAAYPEIDRVEWFEPLDARRRIKEAQAVFIDRLEAALGIA